MRRAITTAIEVGTLSPFTLWIEDENSYAGITKVTNNAPVSACEIIATRTTIQPKALGIWLKNKNGKTLRQELLEQNENNTFNQSQQDKILPYKPRYPNPELETAIEISSTIYDNCEKGVRSPKKGVRSPKREIIQGIVESKLIEKTGVKPQNAEVTRVDTIARPPEFKNQGLKNKKPHE